MVHITGFVGSSAIVLNLAGTFIAGIACAGLRYNIQN